MASAVDVAGAVCRRLQLPPTDVPALHELVYLCQAWCLAWTGYALFDDELVGGPDGPVVPAVAAALRGPGLVEVAEPLAEDDDDVVRSVVEHFASHSLRELVDVVLGDGVWSGASTGTAMSEETLRQVYTRHGLAGEGVPPRFGRPRSMRDDDAAALGREASREWAEGLAMLRDA